MTLRTLMYPCAESVSCGFFFFPPFPPLLVGNPMTATLEQTEPYIVLSRKVCFSLMLVFQKVKKTQLNFWNETKKFWETVKIIKLEFFKKKYHELFTSNVTFKQLTSWLFRIISFLRLNSSTLTFKPSKFIFWPFFSCSIPAPLLHSLCFISNGL